VTRSEESDKVAGSGAMSATFCHHALCLAEFELSQGEVQRISTFVCPRQLG